MPERPKDLPKHCPNCGGSFEAGWGKISTEVRGFHGFGIMGRDDSTRYYCRICFEFLYRAMRLVLDAQFHVLVCEMQREAAKVTA